MEWLKTILEGAAVTDGKLDVEAVMKTVNAEFPKHAVPKQDYNDKVKSWAWPRHRMPVDAVNTAIAR